MKEVQRLSVYEDYGVVTKRKDIHMKHDYTDVECCSETCIHQDLVKIVNDTMPDETELYDLAELFKVFGDSTRIRILYTLFQEELRVSDICEELGMTISAVSHQLRSLKQAKLVRCRREGKMMYYMLADDHVKTIIGMAKEHIEE